MADKSIVVLLLKRAISNFSKKNLDFTSVILSSTDNYIVENCMKGTKKQLVLNKGAEKFIFRYESGCEDQLLDVLIDNAKDSKTGFDWFDAAVLSFKLTQSLIGQADELLRDNKDIKIQIN